jgi:hypothetical protein
MSQGALSKVLEIKSQDDLVNLPYGTKVRFMGRMGVVAKSNRPGVEDLSEEDQDTYRKYKADSPGKSLRMMLE